jgi:hypothetical protein
MSNDKQRSRRIFSSFCYGTVEIIPRFLFLRRQRRWIHYEAAACKIASHFVLQLSIICSLQINSHCGRNFKWSYRHNETLQTIALYSEANHTGPWNHRLVLFVYIAKPARCTIFRVYWILFYMFRTVFPSIIRSPRLYIQRQIYVIKVRWLLASGHEMERAR